MVSPIRVDVNGAAAQNDEPSQLEINAFFNDGIIATPPPTSPSHNDAGNASEAPPRPPEAEVDAVATNNPRTAGEKFIEHFNCKSWK